MKTYCGAVLFIDILGISALTTANETIVKLQDFEAIERKPSRRISNQLFCANLLAIFRKNLGKCRAKDLNIAQFSDCAFLWSADVNLVAETAIKLFQLNIAGGVFARAGMTYGEIIEPDKTKASLGKFICGEAVTRAAKFEGSGKGSRIFIDRHIGGQKFLRIHPEAFKGITNVADFSIVDEFLWFSVPPHIDTRADRIERLWQILGFIGLFLYSPKFRWNAASKQGSVQVGATIERLCIAIEDIVGEINVEPPHFALFSSEMYQEIWTQEKYCKRELDVFTVKAEKWAIKNGLN